MTLLEAAFQYVTVAFPAPWSAQFTGSLVTDDDTDNTAVGNLQALVTGKLETIATELFRQINYSLLSGEYVKDLDLFTHKLSDIENYIKTAGANIDFPFYPNMTVIAQDEFQTYFYKPAKRLLRRYRSLLDFVNGHLIYKQNTSTLFYHVKEENEDTGESEAAKQSSDLFKINIELARIDHSISFSKDYFSKLILIQEQLKRYLASSTLAELLEKKCSFLLYKISFRLKKSQENYLYAIDFNFSSVTLTEVSDFVAYNNIINGHYSGNINTPLFDQRRNAALTRIEQGTTLVFDDYHALTKHYKDDLRDLAKLKALRKQYETFYNANSSTSSKFDQKAFDITKCYLLNNILSLELEKNRLTLGNWKAKFKAYTDEADRYKNKNFFPYYKIVNEFLVDEISSLFLMPDADLKLLKELVDDYELNLTSLIENVGICEETDYLAYQNNYQNCIVEITDSTGATNKCFIASSFVLPLNYKKYKKESDQLRTELYKFRSMHEIQKMIIADRNEVKVVKSEIANTDKRNIEILSIFAALVMFVSNEIQIFSKVPNMADAVTFSLFFAFGLGLFVLMIWLITRPSGLKRTDLKFTHKAAIIFYILGFTAAIIYVGLVKFSASDEKKLKKQQYQIDSLKKARVIDSLNRDVLPKVKSH